MNTNIVLVFFAYKQLIYYSHNNNTLYKII